jgi:inner membrane protein
MENNYSTPPKGKQEDWYFSFLKYLAVTGILLLLWAVLQIVDFQVDDRKKYMQETMDEVGDTWSSDQTLSGPSLRYNKVIYDTIRHYSKRGDSLEINKETKVFSVFPNELDINGNIEEKTLHRAIYDVNVYSLNADVKGTFNLPDKLFEPGVSNIRLVFKVSDLRGIFEPMVISLDTTKYELAPSQDTEGLLIAPVTLNKNNRSFSYSLKLGIKGSNSLMFRPYGDVTSISLKSGYNNPSFKGDFLPIERDVSDSGFTAFWKVLKINRSSPDSAEFGVDLIQPVTQYQMTSRSIKYGVLVILLVFLAAIVVELFTKRKINLLQYAVVGLSLVLFYLLLLSFSDFISFGKAYLVASVMTTLALTAYFKGILKHKSAYLLGLLTFIFLMFSFVMMQMQVYSLLTGSLVLFVILCVIMYLTRNMTPNEKDTENKIETNK